MLKRKKGKLLFFSFMAIVLLWNGSITLRQIFANSSEQAFAESEVTLTSEKRKVLVNEAFLLTVTAEAGSDSEGTFILQLPAGIAYRAAETIKANEGLVDSSLITFNESLAQLEIKSGLADNRSFNVVLQGTAAGSYQIKANKKLTDKEITLATTEINIEAEEVEGTHKEGQAIVDLASGNSKTELRKSELLREAAGVAIGNEAELIAALTSTTVTEMYLTQDVSLSKRAIVTTNNKVLDLNGFMIKATSGSAVANGGQIKINDATGSSVTAFTIKNGLISGGIRYTTNDSNAGFINAKGDVATDSYNTSGKSYTRRANRPENLTVYIEEITYTGPEFFNGKDASVELRDKIAITSEFFNFRVKNLTARAGTDYTGVANGSTAAGANESVNLRYALPVYMGYIQENGSRKVFTIEKGAKVNLTNSGTGSQGWMDNAISGWTRIEVDGSFITSANYPAIRSTASYHSPELVEGERPVINVNQGSVFKATTLKGSNGLIYNYPFEINVNSPLVFDMRFFGRGQFIYAYQRDGSRSDIKFSNTNIAVWNKSSAGIGNPMNMWQDLSYLNIINFYTGSGGILTSDNAHAQDNFDINNYSRISNDLEMPVVLPKLTFSEDVYEIGNSSTEISGKSDYQSPSGALLTKGVPFGTLALKIGSVTTSSQTDANGDWSIPIAKYAAGSTGTLTLTDKDQRYGDVAVKVIDDTPPTAAGKNLSTLLNSTAGIPVNPKQALASFSDETTAAAGITVAYVTTEDELADMVKTRGVKTIELSVKDAAGNETIVQSTLLVGLPEATTKGAIQGSDFRMELSAWTPDLATNRQTTIAKGRVRAWLLEKIPAEDVTNDEVRFTVDTSQVGTVSETPYPILLQVADATKTIHVTFEDNVAPTAKGIVQNINQFDAEALTGANVKSFLKDLQDNVSTADKITAVYQVGQDFTALVATTGLKQVQVIITDEAGNSELILVPIMVSDSSMGTGDLANIQGYDFTMPATDYPSTPSEIRQLIIAKGRLQAISLPDGGNLTQTDELVIDTSQVVPASGKSAPITLTVRDAKKVIYVTFSDTDAPTGSGILQKIKLNDETVLPAAPAKSLVKDLDDNATVIADILVEYAPNQDFSELVASTGYKTIQVIAEDLEGNSATIDIPIFVYDETIAVTDSAAIQAVDFAVSLANLPTTANDLRALVIQDAKVKAWLLPDGNLVDLTDEVLVEIDTSKIQSKIGSYEVRLKVKDAVKVVNVIVTEGSLSFMAAPTDIQFGQQEIKSERAIYPPLADVAMSISDTRGKTADWELYLKVSQELTAENNPTKTIPNGLIFMNEANQEVDINSESNLVRSGAGSLTPANTDVSWNRAAKQGVLLQVRPGQVEAGTYSGELIWTLATTP